MSESAAAAGVGRSLPAPDPLLQIRISSTAYGRLTLRLRGELDVMSAELLEGMLANYPDRRYVRLELGELSFIDGAGLRSITVEHHRLRDRNGELVLTGVGTRMRRLLVVTGLDNVLHMLGGAPTAPST